METSKRPARASYPPEWYDLAAWRRVVELARAQGIDLELELKRERDTVSRARRIAELLAPLDMIQSASISHGTSPGDVEVLNRAYRLKAELAHRRLSIVGLKSGEVLEADVSDRLRDALTRFFDPARRRPRPDGSPDVERE